MASIIACLTAIQSETCLVTSPVAPPYPASAPDLFTFHVPATSSSRGGLTTTPLLLPITETASFYPGRWNGRTYGSWLVLRASRLPLNQPHRLAGWSHLGPPAITNTCHLPLGLHRKLSPIQKMCSRHAHEAVLPLGHFTPRAMDTRFQAILLVHFGNKKSTQDGHAWISLWSQISLPRRLNSGSTITPALKDLLFPFEFHHLPASLLQPLHGKTVLLFWLNPCLKSLH